jgi:hypothetical protein
MRNLPVDSCKATRDHNCHEEPMAIKWRPLNSTELPRSNTRRLADRRRVECSRLVESKSRSLTHLAFSLDFTNILDSENQVMFSKWCLTVHAEITQ